VAEKIELLVVTNNFPFFGKGGEVTFVTPEMSRLLDAEAEITVAPLFPEGKKVFDDPRLKIDLTLARLFNASRWRFVLFGIFCFSVSSARTLYLKEFYSALRLWGAIGAAKSLWWACQALLVERWLLRKFAQRKNTIFVYTFWNTAVTVGCVVAKNNCHLLKVISRVHGYDLYPSRSNPPYIPFREWLYKKIDMVLPIARAGFMFLRKSNVAEEKLFLSYLGTEEPNFLAERSRDDVMRVTSCSFVVPVKRVRLVLEVLCVLAKKFPKKEFDWTHIGDGALFDDLKSVSLHAPPNLKVNLIGYLPNVQVLEFYRNNPVDLFLHLSESEGLPVSMMEVASVGIPIFATDVGGVGEIVTGNSGRLFHLDLSPTEIASILSEYIHYPDSEWLKMRHAARKVWESKFNADLVSSELKRFLFLDK
jgi:glycosyltransferase involved in cell wall biosynthesis